MVALQQAADTCANALLCEAADRTNARVLEARRWPEREKTP